MSSIKEVLARNIEDNIAPVIYFHQLDPQIAEQEVREYVFTTRPSTQVQQVGGIHEQMVELLTNIYAAIEKGHKLPASWISGYFGSGKSSFAKLFGLALDGMILPDGTRMDAALMDRDDASNADELRAAFARLQAEVSSMAVIFDIGTAAKNNESIPHTIYRQVLEKIGYSSHDGVAQFEIALEDEGRYEEFLRLYQEQYGKSWEEKRNGGLAPQQFRAIYKKLCPEQDELLETSTFDLHSLTINKMVGNLVRVMERRIPGTTIFIVVDEVSQYISKDHNKMLDLQSFVSEIGGRARPGRSQLWLIVTGQEKLEEESKDSVLFKLQDRFPPELRVHLDRANVREVVGRRLLKKKAGSALEAFLTDAHIDALKLHAFECASVTRAEVVENYPLLPAHIPLFMDITQSIRNTSIRTQSDSGGVRSVLNNIWDLFNREPVALKNRDIGTLLTIDMLYDIIGSSIDSDVQLTLHKIFEKHPSESWECKTVKAIALLQLNSEERPVLPALLASLLYPALGSPSVLEKIDGVLEILRKENWIQFHDKNGWTIQNNAAQDWNRQKSEISVSGSEIVETLVDLQGKIVETVAQPVYLDARFPLACYWGLDQRLSGKNEATQVSVCFHWASNASKRKNQDDWLSLSRQHPTSFHWVSSDTSSVEGMVRDYRRSMKMVARYRSQGQLPSLQNQLLFRELSESERLFEQIKKELRQLWLDGMLYFNGSVSEPSRSASSFENALKAEIEGKLSLLFHKFSQGHIRLAEADFKQLLERDTAGLALVFFDGPGKLGIAYNDGGKIHFRCSGAVPTDIWQFIEGKAFVTGEQLVEQFASAPYGYSRLVIKASVVGLLREERLRITGNNRSDIGSILDPGARSLFEMDREFNRAEIEAKVIDNEGVSPRDRTEIRQFFEKTLRLSSVDNSSDILADLVFRHFPQLKDRVSEVQKKLSGLGFNLPAYLQDFNKALTDCVSDRQVEKTLRRLKANLDILKEGLPRLHETQEALTDTTEAELRRLRQTLDNEAAQLKELGEDGPIAESRSDIENHLEQAQPWRGYADVKPAAESIKRHYREVRSRLRDAQQQVLDAALDQLKLRADFTDLDEDQQFSVLQGVRAVHLETDAEAVSPSLLVLDQAPQRIREAAAQAQKRVDQFVNEKGKGGERIHTVSLGLRNTIVASEAELELVLARLREKCLAKLKSGAKLRFEE